MKTALIDERVLGVKVFYEDGSVIRIPVEELEQGWRSAPESGVQVVSIYDRKRFELGHYAQWFASHDLYAYSPSENAIYETNRPSELPPDAIVKTGSEMDKPEFRTLYNGAMQDRNWP